LNKKLDRDFYEQVGKMSSDKYYVNEDLRRQAKNSIKGSSKEVAEQFREKYMSGQTDKFARMRQEAKERQAFQAKLK